MKRALLYLACVLAALVAAGRALAAGEINGLIMLIEFEGIDGVRHWERELGYVVSGLHAETPFWDVPFEQQHRLMKQAKDTVETVTGRPMRVFGSRYFAYDENTLKAADALAIVYAPREYRRGSTDADFASVVERVISLRPSDLVLVSHAYLGGTKIRWWRVYEAALARSEVAWRGFDDRLRAARVPLERLEDIPGVRQAAPPTEAFGACQ